MNRKPNVLLLFPDQHRGDWMPYSPDILRMMGLDSLPVRMPHIQQLMDRGVSFINTMSSSPLCAPARACLASGRRYEDCRVPENNYDYDPALPTFYSALKEAGYTVGGVGKFDLHKKTKFWGLDGWVDMLGQMGFTEACDNAGKFDAVQTGRDTPVDPYMAVLHERGWAAYHAENMMTRCMGTDPTELPEDLYCDNWIGQNACRMVEGFEKDRPWFLQVNFAGPHNPWDVTRSMWERWKDVPMPAPNNARETDEYDISNMRRTYAAMLENIDRICGDILKAVEDRGELSNTVVIYSADHGEMLGDFNKFGKHIPDRGSVHIPLVISAPGCQQGKVDTAMAELQDLASTILDLCGVQERFTDESLSLKPLLMGDGKLDRTCQYSSLGEGSKNWVVRQNLHSKIVLRNHELSEVYDLTEDVWQNHNLLEDETCKDRVAAICAQFDLSDSHTGL